MSTRKEIIKIRRELNEIEKSKKPKVGSLKKIIKIVKAKQN